VGVPFLAQRITFCRRTAGRSDSAGDRGKSAAEGSQSSGGDATSIFPARGATPGPPAIQFHFWIFGDRPGHISAEPRAADSKESVDRSDVTWNGRGAGVFPV